MCQFKMCVLLVPLLKITLPTGLVLLTLRQRATFAGAVDFHFRIPVSFEL